VLLLGEHLSPSIEDVSECNGANEGYEQLRGELAGKEATNILNFKSTSPMD